MSDIKHLEYCVRLGNTCVQNKLEQLQQGTYIENDIKNYELQNYNELSFRERLKNWNS
mgnify:CR=1 FL=1